jgi:hypothetical protein
MLLPKSVMLLRNLSILSMLPRKLATISNISKFIQRVNRRPEILQGMILKKRNFFFLVSLRYKAKKFIFYIF